MNSFPFQPVQSSSLSALLSCRRHEHFSEFAFQHVQEWKSLIRFYLQFTYLALLLLAGVSLTRQSYYDTNYAFGGNYGVSSFGIGSFGFGGSAIGQSKPKPRTYIFKPKKVRHYPFKHKMLKPKPQIVDQWPQPSNYALKPVEAWPQAQVVVDGSYLNPVPLQQVPLQLYPSLQDILKLSSPPAPIPAPAPVTSQLPPPSPEFSANLEGIIKMLSSQLSINQMKPSFSSWFSPDLESNSLAQAIELKGNEIIQETSNILSTTQSPIFDLDKLLRKPRSMQ